jgi:hypothetical protein
VVGLLVGYRENMRRRSAPYNEDPLVDALRVMYIQLLMALYGVFGNETRDQNGWCSCPCFLFEGDNDVRAHTRQASGVGDTQTSTLYFTCSRKLRRRGDRNHEKPGTCERDCIALSICSLRIRTSKCCYIDRCTSTYDDYCSCKLHCQMLRGRELGIWIRGLWLHCNRPATRRSEE